MRKRKFTKRSTAWRYLAKKIALDAARGGEPEGLCIEVDNLYVSVPSDEELVSSKLFEKMRSQQNRHRDLLVEDDDYVGPHNFYLNNATSDWVWDADNSENRIMAALFLALEAEDEEKAARR